MIILDFLSNLNITYVVFAAVLLLLLFVQMFYYLYFFMGVVLRNKKLKHGEIAFQTGNPPVSVIICAQNEEDNLKEFLPSVLEQNYPNFEVIVVNDGSYDDTENILRLLSQKYSNLYYTSIPQNVMVLSHKKLAITIGVKAAKNELLVFTDADCRPMSSDWLALMVRNFSPKTEFVLGFGDYFKKKTLINHLISFDTLFIAMQYFGFAYRGFPYMGIGRNMAYRKSTFFKMRGFAGYLHVASGDDDLFVNSAANKENTQIECAKESKTLSVPKSSFFRWMSQKRRHLSVSSFYSSKSKTMLGGEVLSRGMFYAFFMLLLLTQNLIFIIFALSLFFIRFVTQLIVINRTAKQLGTRKFFLIIILWDILLPLISLYLLTVGKLFHRKKSNVWG